MKKQKKKVFSMERWDLSEGMGILPDDMPFTQNVGCVGGRDKKPKADRSNLENKS